MDPTRSRSVTVGANSSVSGELASPLVRECASVERHYDSGDKTTARQQLKRLRREHAGSPVFRGVAAKIAYLDGRFEDALRDILVALDKQPDNTYHWNSYGQVLRQLERFDDAAEAYNRSILLSPVNSDAHNNLGIVLRYLGRSEDAIAAFQRAIELNPESFTAIRNLSLMRGFVFDAPELERIRQLALVTPDAEGQVRCYHALYNSLSRMGEDEQALEHLDRGNNIHFRDRSYKDLLGPFTDYLVANLAAEHLVRQNQPTAEAAHPVFIVGMPRTGSSLLEQMLSAHPEMVGLGERKDMARLFQKISLGKPARARPVMDIMARLDRRVTALADHFMLQRQSESAGYQCVTDKTLSNFVYVGFIRQLFPDARFIHVKRHPLDTIAACYETSFTDGHDYSYDLDALTKYYLSYRRLMDHWQAILPEDIHEVEYESLVLQAETTIADCLAFMGLPMRPECLLPEQNARVVTSTSTEQVREKIHSRSLGRWHRFERRFNPVIRQLEEAGINLA